MSRFRKLSHAIWHCQYHIIWVPKYRYRILAGPVASEIEKSIRAFSDRLGAEVGVFGTTRPGGIRVRLHPGWQFCSKTRDGLHE